MFINKIIKILKKLKLGYIKLQCYANIVMVKKIKNIIKYKKIK